MKTSAVISSLQETNSKLPHNAKTIFWKIRKLSKPLPWISNEKREGLQYLESVTADEANKAWESPSLWVKSSQNDLEVAAATTAHQRMIQSASHKWRKMETGLTASSQKVSSQFKSWSFL